jgi:plasmid maintenance system antidote protein VapI
MAIHDMTPKALADALGYKSASIVYKWLKGSRSICPRVAVHITNYFASLQK